jgi:hypothetical protein
VVCRGAPTWAQGRAARDRLAVAARRIAGRERSVLAITPRRQHAGGHPALECPPQSGTLVQLPSCRPRRGTRLRAIRVPRKVRKDARTTGSKASEAANRKVTRCIKTLEPECWSCFLILLNVSDQSAPRPVPPPARNRMRHPYISPERPFVAVPRNDWYCVAPWKMLPLCCPAVLDYGISGIRPSSQSDQSQA